MQKMKTTSIKLDENRRKSSRSKSKYKEQVSMILPRIKKSVNEQLEAEVLTRSSNEAKTSHAIAANLSELELKKILIDKIENTKINPPINTVMLKRRRDDVDKDKEPSAGSNRGSKRRRAGKEPESTSAPKEKTSKSTIKSKDGRTYSYFSELNYERMQIIGHIKWIEDLVPNTMWSQVPIIYDKHAVWGISHWGRKRQQFFGFTVNRESAHDVYSRNRIIGIKKLTIVEWHNYKHLEWITIHRDDDKLYTFKEGDYNRLRLQDIEDMLLLLVQSKLTNLNVEECLALGVSLRKFTISMVIRRRVEDL
ncbi:hypothetical protein Tco_0413357 [Tanacetum coccineum]